MNRRAYTLLELLTAMATLCVIMLLLFSTTGMATLAWKENASSTETFQQARAAFSTLTRRVSQATLNSYQDYFDTVNWNFNSSKLTQGKTEYRYRSELHFLTGRAVDLIPDPGAYRPTHTVFFQAPLGYRSDRSAPSRSLLNVCGYYVEYGSDENSRPDFTTASTTAKYRYRLYEALQPSEDFAVYKNPKNDLWLKNFVIGSMRTNTRVLAENIIALILQPQRRPDDTGIAPRYAYDSRAWIQQKSDALATLTQNQLPPLMQVTMVVIDEASARRMQAEGPEVLKGLVDPTLFQDATLYSADMKRLQDSLKDRCRYRCFQTTVSLASSTWSDGN